MHRGGEFCLVEGWAGLEINQNTFSPANTMTEAACKVSDT